MAMYIIGCGGYGREVAEEFVHSFKGAIPFFLTDEKELWETNINGLTVQGNIESVPPGNFIVAVGNPTLKRELVNRALEFGHTPFTVISRKAMINSHNEIGLGVSICGCTSITCNTQIGSYSNINLNCTVGHDAIIGQFCNLSPGVHVSGKVEIGDMCDIGTGAVILPGISIGANSIIGAGAVVTKNIPPNSVAVGIPAKVIKTNA